MRFKDFINEGQENMAGYRKIIVQELNSIFNDMDTDKGRWFSKNAPKKLVQVAIKNTLTNDVMNNLYNRYVREQKRLNKKMSFKEFIELDNIYNTVMGIHRKVYSYVNKHGDEEEWKGKWGSKF